MHWKLNKKYWNPKLFGWNDSKKPTLSSCPVNYCKFCRLQCFMNIKYVQIYQIRHVRNIKNVKEEIYEYLLIFCALLHRVCGVEKFKIKLRLGKLLTYFYKDYREKSHKTVPLTWCMLSERKQAPRITFLYIRLM